MPLGCHSNQLMTRGNEKTLGNAHNFEYKYLQNQRYLLQIFSKNYLCQIVLTNVKKNTTITSRRQTITSFFIFPF